MTTYFSFISEILWSLRQRSEFLFFSVKGQIATVLGLGGHTTSVTTLS